MTGWLRSALSRVRRLRQPTLKAVKAPPRVVRDGAERAEGLPETYTLVRASGDLPCHSSDDHSPVDESFCISVPPEATSLAPPDLLCFVNGHDQPVDSAVCRRPPRLEPLHLPVIHNAQLIGRGFVTSGDRLVAESFQQRHARSLGLEHVENGTWRISNRLRMSLHRWQKQHPVSVYERTAILLHDYAIEHFGVWILKILPKLSMAGLLQEDALTVVVPLGLPDKYLNHLTLLGFDPRQILFHDPAGISRFRRLVIPPSPYVFQSPSNRFAFRTDPFGVFVNNQDAWSRFDAIAPHRGRRIFVSRLGNVRRKLENEEKIQRLFADHGFDIVEPSSLTAAEAMTLFRNCRFVAGTSGSGLFNILLSKHRFKALVLVPPVLKYEGEFLVMADICAVRRASIGYIFGKMLAKSTDQSAKVFDYTWTIDPGALAKVLERVV